MPIDDADLEDFLDKVEDVESAIKGLQTGSITTDDLNKTYSKLKDVDEQAKQRKEKEKKEIEEMKRKKKPTVEDLNPRQREEYERLLIRKKKHLQRVQGWNEYSAAHGEEVDHTQATDFRRWDRWEPDSDSDGEVFVPENSGLNQIEADMKERAKRRKENKERAEKLRKQGSVLYKKGLYQEASWKYEECVDLVRDEPVYRTNAAQAFIKLGRFEEAAKECELALKLDDKNVKAMAKRSIALSSLGRHEDATAQLEQATCVKPGDKELATMLVAEKLKRDAQRRASKLRDMAKNNEASASDLKQVDACLQNIREAFKSRYAIVPISSNQDKSNQSTTTGEDKQLSKDESEVKGEKGTDNDVSAAEDVEAMAGLKGSLEKLKSTLTTDNSRDYFVLQGGVEALVPVLDAQKMSDCSRPASSMTWQCDSLALQCLRAACESGSGETIIHIRCIERNIIGLALKSLRSSVETKVSEKSGESVVVFDMSDPFPRLRADALGMLAALSSESSGHKTFVAENLEPLLFEIMRTPRTDLEKIEAARLLSQLCRIEGIRKRLSSAASKVPIETLLSLISSSDNPLLRLCASEVILALTVVEAIRPVVATSTHVRAMLAITRAEWDLMQRTSLSSVDRISSEGVLECFLAALQNCCLSDDIRAVLSDAKAVSILSPLVTAVFASVKGKDEVDSQRMYRAACRAIGLLARGSRNGKILLAIASDGLIPPLWTILSRRAKDGTPTPDTAEDASVPQALRKAATEPEIVRNVLQIITAMLSQQAVFLPRLRETASGARPLADTLVSLLSSFDPLVCGNAAMAVSSLSAGLEEPDVDYLGKVSLEKLIDVMRRFEDKNRGAQKNAAIAVAKLARTGPNKKLIQELRAIEIIHGLKLNE